jgi:hypothetical protein
MNNDIGVMSKKKIAPSTIGFTNLPSNSPKSYQRRFRGSNRFGVMRVSRVKQIERVANKNAHIDLKYQKNQAARIAKTIAKNQPNFWLVGSIAAESFTFME